MAAPPLIMIATPLLGRDAALVPGWSAAVALIAQAHPEAKFVAYAAVRRGDSAATEACAAAGVTVVDVPWYGLARGPAGHPPANPIGVTLKRARLVRAAAEAGATVIWFVSADVRVAPEHWAAVDGVFRAGGAGVVLVPYPNRWSPSREPLVCAAVGGAAPAICDARQVPPSGGAPDRPFAVVLGGGLGCLAILTAVAARVPFVDADARGGPTPLDLAGAAWFLNAARKKVEIRMPVGVLARHLGCVAVLDHRA